MTFTLVGRDKLTRIFDGAAAGARRLERALENVGNQSRASLGQLSRDVDAIDRQLTSIGKGVAVTALAGSFVKLAGAVAPAAGALAALPAIGLSMGAAFATAKLATAGMGDAMDAVAEGDAAKLNKALKELAPSARGFMRALFRAREAFEPIQKAVQGAFFAGLGAQVDAVAQRSLPVLRSGLVGVAGALNAVAAEALSAADTPWFSGAVRTVLNTTAAATRTLAGAVRPLTGVVAKLVDVGAPYVTQLADWVAGGAKAADAFLNTRRGATLLASTVTAGVRAFKNLAAIAGNLGAALLGVFRAANSSGRSFLDTLREGTEALAQWANSARGQRQLAALFETLTTVAAATIPVLKTVAAVVMRLAQTFGALPAPIRQILASMTAWTLVLTLISTKLFKAGAAVKLLATPLASVLRLVGILPAKTSAQTAAVAANTAAIRAQTAALTGQTTATTASATATAAAVPWWKRLGRAVAFYTKKLVLATAATLKNLAVMVARTAAAAAVVVAKWIWMGVVAMANAVRIAAAWLIALGPVGWAIAAILAVAAAFAILWVKSEAFRNFWKGLWKDIQGLAAKVGAWFKGPFVGFFQLTWRKMKQGWNTFKHFFTRSVPAAFRNAWDAAVSWTARKAGEIYGLMRSLPGRLVRALGDLGNLLVNAGMDLIRGLGRGIMNALNWLLDQVRNIAGMIASTARSALGIGSPSRVFARIGEQIAAGLAQGIAGSSGLVTRATRALIGATTTPMGRAAREILSHLRAGGSLFEDFSFRGSSAVVRRFNDELAARFYRANPGFDFGGHGTRRRVERFLRDVAAAGSTDVAAALAGVHVTVHTELKVDSKTLARAVEQGRLELARR